MKVICWQSKKVLMKCNGLIHELEKNFLIWKKERAGYRHSVDYNTHFIKILYSNFCKTSIYDFILFFLCNIFTRMTTFIKVKLKTSDERMNIDNHQVDANIQEYQIISKNFKTLKVWKTEHLIWTFLCFLDLKIEMLCLLH